MIDLYINDKISIRKNKYGDGILISTTSEIDKPEEGFIKELVREEIIDLIDELKDQLKGVSDPIKYKICSSCNERLPHTSKFFYKKSNSQSNLSSRCKRCTKESSRRWRNENRDRAAAWQKDYYEKNKEIIKKAALERYYANKG